MFNIGLIEFLLIFFFLILLIRPEDIPKVSKNLGLIYRKVSRYFYNIKYELSEIEHDISVEKKLRKTILMKYLSHLRELRSRLLFSFLFLILCFIFFLYNASFIGEILSEPLFNLLKDSQNKRMIFTALPEIFLSNLKISLFASFIFTLPFLLIQLILFISPAMYKKEKKHYFQY